MDVIGGSRLRKLADGAGRAEIELLAGPKTTLALRALPRDVIVNRKALTVTQELGDGICYVTLKECPPGERKITLRW